ncbi:MAG: Trk system potassium transporter TrkA [Bacteroidales bacterium]|nr:Trk system potassium transporter TrkA [Bacteroidales bacterium]
MKIFIAGAGEVGKHLAKLFVEGEHEVTIMDEDRDKLDEVARRLDLMTHCGQMTSIEALRSAEVGECDLFIAVPPYPDMSILAAILAKQLGANTTIARVNNSEYLQKENLIFFRQLGIDELIYPERLGADEVVEALKRAGIRQMFESSDGQLALTVIKVRDNAPIINIPLMNLDAHSRHSYNLVAINRRGETIIPHGSDALQNNDLGYFVTTHQNIPSILTDCGKEQKQISNVMIIGGSRLARLMAHDLEDKYNVKLIEISREKSNRLANELERTLIINGDGRNMQLLRDEGIAKMDAFIAVTDNSEINILACQLAKKFGVVKTVAEVENLDYIPLAEEIGIGTVINKKLIAASYIYRHTLLSQSSYIKYLSSTNAEMLELVAQEGSKITKTPIRELSLPKDVNIGGLVRNGEPIIVDGSTRIEVNDKVLIFATQQSIHKIEKLFV